MFAWLKEKLKSQDTVANAFGPRPEKPASGDARYADARALRGKGDLDASLVLFRELLGEYPKDIDLLIEATKLLEKLENYGGAKDLLERAFDLDPQNTKVNIHLGTIHRNAKQYDDASYHFELALRVFPESAVANLNMGLVFLEQNEFDKSIPYSSKAAQLKPDFGKAHYYLACAYYGLGMGRECLEYMARAVALDPYNADYLSEYGGAIYYFDGALEKSRIYLEKALEIDPGNFTAQLSLASVEFDSHQFERAKIRLKKLIEAYPKEARAKFWYGLCCLMIGDFAEGWPHYSLRKVTHKDSSERGFALPFWDGGQDLSDKVLLVYAEQGLGDEIMFSSCIPDVAKLCGSCILECDPRLIPLFQRSFPSITVVPRVRKEDSPKWLANFSKIDYQAGIADLPLQFRNRWEDFPDHKGYLIASAEKRKTVREKLDALPHKLNVGISWRGGTLASRREIRSIPLSQWKSFFDIGKVNFISLQYTNCESEIAEFESDFGYKVHHWADVIEDYDLTASVVMELDLIISVCTSIVHLAGALGKPIWVVAPNLAEWRYLRVGEKLPWYPSAKVYRQAETSEWGDVILRVQKDLERFVSSGLE